MLREKKRKYNLGGVGNLIMNLNNLNIKFKLFSYVGHDKNGKKARLNWKVIMIKTENEHY